MTYDIVGVRAENLRGYRSTSLVLDRRVSVLVGPNNSGKTSIFRLLSWVLNDLNIDDLASEWQLPRDVCEFMLPARETRHRARRLTIDIRIADGRMHRKYQCVGGVAQLRFNIRLSPSVLAYVALGDAKRGEPATSEHHALELLRRVQAATKFVYVPSFRDVASNRFKQTMRSAFLSRLGPKVLHHHQGGAPREYRKVKGALESITNTLEKLVVPLWADMDNYIPPGLAKKGKVSLNCDVKDVVDFLSTKFSIRVSTGEHDSSFVPLRELGSGSQSLLAGC